MTPRQTIPVPLGPTPLVTTRDEPMPLPRVVRDGLAATLRTVRFKGSWRVGAAANRLFPQDRVRVRLPETGLMEIDLRDGAMSGQLYWVGVGNDDRALIAALRKLMPSGGVFLDVGANIGLYSLALAGQPGARVVAFEPNPRNLELLRRNVELNGLANVEVAPLGVSDAPGRITVSGSDAAGNWSLVTEGPVRFEIDLTSLDAYFAAHPVERLDVMKIDIEGCETKALAGARRTLDRFRPAMVLEVNKVFLPRMGSSPEELLRALDDLGYDRYRIDGGRAAPFDPLVFEKDPALEMVNALAVPRERSRELLAALS